MADAGQELESAIALIYDAAARLKAKHPGHELLEYVEGVNLLRLPDEFVQEFGGPSIPEVHRGTEFARASMYANFANALEKAIDV